MVWFALEEIQMAAAHGNFSLRWMSGEGYRALRVFQGMSDEGIEMFRSSDGLRFEGQDGLVSRLAILLRLESSERVSA
jgi:hypothetical protein